ncbi:MAG: glycosyltransferase [Blastocatellia bacterium]|nr:glycosyltransferase [Blastocatellia bacterium]
MKVLHVIPSVAPRYGGPSRAIYEMCRAVAATGTDVAVCTTNADGAGRLPVKLGEFIEYEGIHTIFFDRQWSEAFKYSRPLAKWLRRNVTKYDVVHIHAVFSHACLAAANACRKAGIPYIIRPLGTLDPWSTGQKPFRKKLFWHLGVGRMLQEANAIHYTAEDEKRLAEEPLGLARGMVIPLGVNLSTFGTNEHDSVIFENIPELRDRNYILFLSRLHPKKGVEILLDAFAGLQQDARFRDWHLVVAGDGEPDYVASLRRIVQDGGQTNHVHFIGWADGPVKVSAYRRAALFALPSFQENFALCVVESLACGVPVLISPHVNLAPEVTNAGAGWVADVEGTAFAETLLEVCANPTERHIRGERGKKFVHSCFDWPVVALALNSLYASLAESTPPESVQPVT